MNILVLLGIITGAFFIIGAIFVFVGEAEFSTLCEVIGVIILCCGIVSGGVLSISIIEKDNQRDISKCEFDSVNKQQISEFVTKNDTLSVELADGTVYGISESPYCGDLDVYIVVNTSSSSNGFIPAGTKVRYNKNDSFYYNIELWTNVLLVDKETYDKIFTVKPAVLSK